MSTNEKNTPSEQRTRELPAWVTEELIEATHAAWGPYYDISLTRDEAIEIILAASRLFGVVSQQNHS